MDNVKLFSNKVWLAEEQGDPDALIAKIVICDFSVNKNGVMLNRDTIEEWMSSLVNAPLVGKIKAKSNGEIDFTSHNATVVTRVDENGNEYADIEFNTDAFGTFVDASIETIEGVECIVATARVWKRFYDASNLIVKRIKEGTLSTSWEIAVEKSTRRIMNGSLVKVIDRGRFVGHTLLSAQTQPAYSISRVLEVAAKDDDEELCSALIRDVMKMNDSNGNEVEKMDEVKTIDTSEQEVIAGGVELGEEEKAAETQPEETGTTEEQAEEKVETEPEKAELTMRDLRWKIEEALYKYADRYLDVVFIFTESHIGWAHDWSENETDMYEFAYTVENDEVSISSLTPVKLVVSPREINFAMTEKSDALIEAQKQINELTAQIAELAPYKEAAEQAAREKAEAERKEKVDALRAYAEESGMVSKEELESGEIAEMIENLKETELKVLICDRIVAKQKKAKPTETASVNPTNVRTNIFSSAVDDSYSIFREKVFGSKR